MCALIASSIAQFSWTPDSMMSTQVISDVQLSPDNESVLFVVAKPKMEEEKGISLSVIYKSDIEDPKGAKSFSNPHFSSAQPRWSPDGNWVAFLSDRDAGIKNLYVISSSGGEAIQLTKAKKDVQTFSWSPNGEKIVFVMADERDNEKNRMKSSLAYVYKDEAIINRLWLVDVWSPQPLPKPLTGDTYCVRGMGDFGTINREFDWSPDSKQIIFAYSPGVGFDDYHLDSSIATIDLEDGKITPWDKKAVYEALPHYSPDGQWVAYLNGEGTQRYTMNRRVAIRSSKGEGHRLLSNTFNEGPFLMGANLIGWTQDGNHLLFFEPKGTKFHLMLVPTNGQPAREIASGDYFFKEPSLSYDRSRLACVIQSPSQPPEAYVVSLNKFEPIQISHLNDHLLDYPKLETEVISWVAKDGLNIEGLLTYPINYQRNKKYPLLLVIHGGPAGFFDQSFLGTPYQYPYAAFAQAGFMILKPNPRGSSGYGKNFRCANYNDWGGSDLADLMAGVDELIAEGMVDSDRLGVMGWSYGGYMTSWTITQTDRFKAASMGAGLCNLASMAGTTDLHHFLTDYLGEFSANKELYHQRSPINFVTQVTTPCLIQHGVEDKRVPVSQAYEFYHALNRLEKLTTLILYPGMEHRLTDPKMMLDAMKSNLSWFQHHLLDH